MTGGRQHAAATAAGPLALVAALRRVNRAVAILCGAALLMTVALILFEITMRRLAGGGLGGSDEISGYVMAGVATWGFAFALVERAHVRIDVLQMRLPAGGRAALDVLALASLCAISAIVAFHAWSVLGTSLARGSRANTPLETPLWIPQSIWFAGWIWLTLTSAALLACAVTLLVRRRPEAVAAIAGMGAEGGEAAA